MSSHLEAVSKENTKDFHGSDSGKTRYGRGYAVSRVGAVEHYLRFLRGI